MPKHIDIVFDRQPGPVSPGFVEVEDGEGRSISLGEWVQRDDLWWVLRITKADIAKFLED